MTCDYGRFGAACGCHCLDAEFVCCRLGAALVFCRRVATLFM